MIMIAFLWSCQCAWTVSQLPERSSIRVGSEAGSEKRPARAEFCPCSVSLVLWKSISFRIVCGLECLLGLLGAHKSEQNEEADC